MNLQGGVTRFLRMNQYTQERYELSAQDGYEAYGRTTDFKNYQGLPMPSWEELPEKIKQAWIAATKEILDNPKQR